MLKLTRPPCDASRAVVVGASIVASNIPYGMQVSSSAGTICL